MAFLSDSNIVRIIVNQTLFNQPLMNVFWFEWNAIGVGTMDLETLLDDFWLQLAPVWKPMVSLDLKFNSLEATIMNVVGQPFQVKGLVEAGSIAIGSFPSNVSATFKLGVSTRITRPGSKRIAGIAEPDGEQNTWIAGFVTRANAFANKIGSPMPIKNDLNVVVGDLVPRVYKRPSPPNSLVYVGQDVTSCSLNMKVGSQNTRKP